MVKTESSPGSPIRDRVGGVALREPSLTNSSTSTGNGTSVITSDPDPSTEHFRFENWVREVRLDPKIQEDTPKGTLFEPIRSLQNASKLFPRWATNPAKFRFTASFHEKWRDRLCAALQDSKYQFYEDEDGKIIPPPFPFIFHACQEHSMARLLDREESVKKMGLSRAVDNFIVICLNCDGTERLSYRRNQDQETRLLATKVNRFAETAPVDGFGLIEIPNFEPCAISQDFEKAVSAVCIDSEVMTLLLVHLVVSYIPRGSAEDRMKLALVSALHQKKVLGVRDQFVFGVFQFDTDFLQVVAGIWQDDEMKIYRVGTYSLTDPLSATQFFLIIRGIDDLAKVYESRIVALGPALAMAARANPPTNEWAQPFEDVNQGLFQELSALEQWDAGERIDAFREGTRDCEPFSLSPKVHDF